MRFGLPARSKHEHSCRSESSLATSASSPSSATSVVHSTAPCWHRSYRRSTQRRQHRKPDRQHGRMTTRSSNAQESSAPFGHDSAATAHCCLPMPAPRPRHKGVRCQGVDDSVRDDPCNQTTMHRPRSPLCPGTRPAIRKERRTRNSDSNRGSDRERGTDIEHLLCRIAQLHTQACVNPSCPSRFRTRGPPVPFECAARCAGAVCVECGTLQTKTGPTRDVPICQHMLCYCVTRGHAGRLAVVHSTLPKNVTEKKLI